MQAPRYSPGPGSLMARSLAWRLIPAPGGADLRPLDLSAGGLRQLVSELDYARVLVRRSQGLDVLLQFDRQLHRRLVALAQHDDRAHHRSTLVVRIAHRRRLRDGGVFDQRRLDLERA